MILIGAVAIYSGLILIAAGGTMALGGMIWWLISVF
jgi:hypothetical protein